MNKKLTSKIYLILIFSVVFGVTVLSRAETSSIDSLKFKVGDEKNNDIKALKSEVLIKKSEVRAIAQVQKLLRIHKGTALEPSLMFRLAELYIRRAKANRFLELQRKSETLVLLAPTLIKSASSKKMVKKAIRVYNRIIKRHPRFGEMDMVLYSNAMAHQGLRMNTKADKLYWKLISKYGNSHLVPDAHLAIGEMAFEMKKFTHALKHFQIIRSYPNSKVYPYGLYKAGWTYYNLKRTKEGMKELEEVVKYGELVESKGWDIRLDLRKEALTDMTLFYEDVYPAKGAYDYFVRVSGSMDAVAFLNGLSNIYKRHARFKEREILLRSIVENNQTSPRLPQVYNDMVHNYEMMRNRSSALGALEEMANLCTANGDWVSAASEKLRGSGPHKIKSTKNGEVDLKQECLSSFNNLALKLAQKWLRLWKKNPTHLKFADVSEKAFALYLENNPQSQTTLKTRYAYAELLFKRGKFTKAGRNYAVVSQKIQDKKLAHDSSYAALVSLEKGVGKTKKWKNDDKELFVKLTNLYVTNHPKGKYRLDLEFKLALFFYEDKKYETAAPVFKRLGENYANEQRGQMAQDLYLEILNIQKDYKAIRSYTHQLLAANMTKKPARKKKLNGLFQQASFLEIQVMEKNGNRELAILSYEKFANEHPKSQLGEKALWNAVQLLFLSHNLSRGAQLSELFYKRYKASDRGVEPLLKAAQAYESMGQIRETIRTLIELSKGDKKAKYKWLALAGDFYLYEGRTQMARDLYKRILRESPAKEEQNTALLKLAELAKSEGNLNEMVKLQTRIIRKGIYPEASTALVELVEGDFKAQRWEKAFLGAKKVLNLGAKAPASIKARARLVQARILDREFRKQSIKSSIERIALVLAIKTEKLDKTQRAYQATIRFGDAKSSIVALEELSASYAHYSQALKNIPRPRGLSPSEEGVFMNEINRIAIPMEEKAGETLVDALKLAKALKLRDGEVGRIQNQLDKFNMVQRPLFRPDPFGPEVMMLPTFKREAGS